MKCRKLCCENGVQFLKLFVAMICHHFTTFELWKICLISNIQHIFITWMKESQSATSLHLIVNVVVSLDEVRYENEDIKFSFWNWTVLE
jgi:hypothetical protein